MGSGFPDYKATGVRKFQF